MTSIRNFERMLFCCPEVNVSEYPLASDEEFLLMEHNITSEFVCVYPFVRKEDGRNPYVEIYIWDKKLSPDTYERFIICEGMRLPDDLEYSLLGYCKKTLICIDNLSMERFNSILFDCFPQWHYVPYSSENVGRCIEHIYYASHRSGPREILYKAGLENIAYNLDKLPRVNLIGSTASSIVDHNMPIKLLRILNQQELIDVLYEYDRSECSIRIYKTYASYIGESIPSANQWRYLEKLYFDNIGLGDMGFNRSIYNCLANTDDTFVFDTYMRYFKLYEELKIEKRMRIPKADELLETTKKLEQLREYREKSVDLDKQLKSRKHFAGSVYEYSGDPYIVILPNSCADICKEAISQNNCLMDYICDHAKGKTTILFLRKKDKPEEPFVTMEVKNWQVKQVYGCCNTIPRKDVFQFLIEKYSKNTYIYMDLHAIIDDCLDDKYEIDDDLMKYLNGLLKSNITSFMNMEQDAPECIQLTFADYLPNVFD